MSLPQANAEAIFEISREIATAKNAVRDYGLYTSLGRIAHGRADSGVPRGQKRRAVKRISWWPVFGRRQRESSFKKLFGSPKTNLIEPVS